MPEVANYGFDEWMRLVNELSIKNIGLVTDDLVDKDYDEYFRKGVTPAAMVEILQSEL